MRKERKETTGSTGRPGRTSTSTLARLTALLVAALVLVGCHRRHDVVETPAPETPKLAPEAIPGLTPERLLREVAFAYANAKFYSDEGYAEIVYERESDHSVHSSRAACALEFAKPNYVRAEFGQTLLRSDGKTLRAEILDDAFAGQALERPAPFMLTAVREFYPDPEFAAAANLGVPVGVFWTSPQLALLFARKPLETIAPADARLKLLDPAYLRFETAAVATEPASGGGSERGTLCDRVQLSCNDGVRVYWIERATRALARCELAAERVAAPEPDARVLAVRLEFPNQRLQQTPSEELDRFEFDAADEVGALRLVSRFERPEIAALSARFPTCAILPAAESDADAFSGPTARPVLLAFMVPTASAEEVAALCAFAEARPEVEVWRVDAEDSGTEPDAAGPADSDADSGSDSDSDAIGSADPEGVSAAPLVRRARLNRETLTADAPDYPAITAGTRLLLDSEGGTLCYVSGGSDSGRLLAALDALAEGIDPRTAQRLRGYEHARGFARFMDSASARELYRVPFDFNESLDVPPRLMTKTMRLREVWRRDDLVAPCNPLAVSAPRNDRAPDAWETVESSSSSPRRATGLRDLLVVPCDGNALALITPQGKLLRKTSPSASFDEPIRFVRSADVGTERRYFVAGASDVGRNLHRFDEDFNDLGSLAIASGDDRVGDARLADVNRDGIPELVASVTPGPDASSSAPGAVMAIGFESREILWRDESARLPRRLAIDVCHDDEEFPPTLWSSDASSVSTGRVTAYDASVGQRGSAPRLKRGETLTELASTTRPMPSGASFAALGVDDATGVGFLAGFDASGMEVWRNVAPSASSGRLSAASTLERLMPGDIDGDGIDEWIVASENGTIRFFDASGRELDVFQYGSRLTGACVARWHNASFLIVTTSTRTSAWRIDRRN